MSTLLVEKTGPIVRVKLNRPEVRNALNDEVMKDLQQVFQGLAREAAVRVVILSGQGAVFCAGADLNWLKSQSSLKANRADMKRLPRLLSFLNSFPKPLVTLVQGAAVGGGVGLLSTSDIAVAAEGSLFGLSEVRIGLMPAVISPYVIQKIGLSNARRYFLTGERMDAAAALRSGLIHEVVPPERLEARGAEIAHGLLACGPQAIQACKRLIRKVAGNVSRSLEEYALREITALRKGEEAQEGIRAFLDKRKPRWQE